MKKKISSTLIKDTAARYLKVVEWSEKDRCFVGRCPGLFFGGCHGKNEQKVYKELCEIVDEHVADLLANKGKLPEATAGKTYSGKFVARVGSSLHERIVLEALSSGRSLNQLVVQALERLQMYDPAQTQ